MRGSTVGSRTRDRLGEGALVVSLLLAVLALALPSAASAANLSSDFEGTTDGWKAVATDGTNAAFDPVLFESGGVDNSDYISASDDEATDDQIWVFQSPDTWDGDLRSNYGGDFQFSLLHPAGADIGGLIQIGSGTEVLQAGLEAFGDPPTTTQPPPDADTWTQYQFAVRAGAPDANWMYSDFDTGDSRSATLADFRNVLADVDAIIVVGDLKFDSVGETTGLDNISLTEPATALDFDGDGVADIEDECPGTDGPASNNGCPLPDNDGDGVPNVNDDCPAVDGPASNNGCPLDTADPQTTIKRAKINQAKDKATFKFASSEAGSSFECKLDKKRFKSCSSPKTYKRLRTGRHKFKVRATDAAGNLDSSAAVKRFRIKR